MVVEEYERGNETLSGVQRKYYIKGKSTLSRWVKEYSISNTLPKQVRVEMKGESSRKDTKIKELEDQVMRLKEALADETLGKKCVEAEFLAWKRIAGEVESSKIEKKSQNIRP